MSEEKPTPASENPEAPASASDKGGYNANMIKSLDDVEHVRTQPRHVHRGIQSARASPPGV